MLLVAAGVVAALLHIGLRWPLKLPGHHGLEWLAILLAARVLSQRPGAALAVAIGAAATAFAGGGHEGMLRPLTYLVQGVALDGLWLLLQARVAALWLAVPLGALVHALAPMLKNVVAVAGGAASGSLAQGLAWPLATHALFGAVGAIVGTFAAAVLQRRRTRR